MATYEERIFKRRRLDIYRTGGEIDRLLILNDGDILSRVENNIVEKLDARVEGLMLLALEPMDRFKDYSPWYQESFVSWIDNFLGEGDLYLDFLIYEIIPYLEEAYSLKFKEVYLAGASLGGLISTYGVFRNNEIFKGGVFVSASYWYEGFLNYLKTAKNIDSGTRIYMDVGDREPAGRITLFKDIVEETNKVYGIFLNKGIARDNICYRIKKDMGHNEGFFIDRIYKGILWLMG